MVAAALIAGVGIAGASAATPGGLPNHLSPASATHSRPTPSSAAASKNEAGPDAAESSGLSRTDAQAPVAPSADTSAGVGSDDRAGSATAMDGSSSGGDLSEDALERLVDMPPRGEALVGAAGRIKGVAALSRTRKLSAAGPLLARSGSRIQSLPVTQWVNPLPGAIVTSCFGVRWGRLHAGVDLATTPGTPIRAAGAGIVVAAGADAGYGNAVLIDHGNGFLTHYGHMSAVTARAGQHVAAGEQIGNEGSTGHSTGPHLHFEVHRGAYKNPIEPTRWMRAHGVTLPGCG
jgi:murein DD-endopeptidase MepM/ murein hydrolase activator NlpD